MKHFKKTIIAGYFIASSLTLMAQKKGDYTRPNDWRFRWNMGQFANIGRYAFQFGVEKDIADNKTLGGELGLSFYRGTDNIFFQRYNYSGVQGFVEYKNYFKYFNDKKVRPYLALGIFGRTLNFDADVDMAFNITSSRDWNNATHYETATTHYKTTTGRLHAGFGFRAPLSPMMYFECTGGPAFGWYNVQNDLVRNAPFIVDNFNNPFFMSAQTGSYFSPALYGSVAFGFVIARVKPAAAVAP